MRFPLLIALSHLRARRKDAGISVITGVSIMGVTVGVTALIMVLAVMEGFEIDLRDKILGSNAHLVVLHQAGEIADYEAATETLEQVPGIVAAAPFVYYEVMIRSRWAASGAVLKGIDPEHSGEVTDVVADLVRGPDGELTDRAAQEAVIHSLAHPPPAQAQDTDDTADLPGIILGKELAEHLAVTVGDTVHLINPIGGGTGPMGMPVPRVQPFRVAGIFYSGMYEYDTKWTYVTIQDAQDFLEMGDTVTGIEARVDDIDAVGPIADRISAVLPYPYYVRHWKNLNRNLFSALKLEKIVMGLILSLIVAVASLNIVGTLILIVVTRAREISILRAMGASKRDVRTIFMLQGLIIGLVGTTVGTALGLIGCRVLKAIEFPLDTDVYYLDTLPVVVVADNVVVVAIAAVLICFLATLYPASVAAGIDPVEGLRYE
ncbi:MAG: ABC transporter permease [Deltaproteobacteria bacterium]|nr:MAG: ABC transporter permease [Deltaproteobacteria bacterium]